MTVAIPIKNRYEQVVALALVDEHDAVALDRWPWRLSKGYVTRIAGPVGKRHTLGMHRAIMGLGLGDPVEVDHRNRNPLDNRRSNLRIVTHAENQQNLPSMGRTSRFRGVSWFKRDGVWQAEATIAGKKHYLGRFSDEAEAARVAAAFRRAHSPFAIEAAIV